MMFAGRQEQRTALLWTVQTGLADRWKEAIKEAWIKCSG
jgi:hypothetical protein